MFSIINIYNCKTIINILLLIIYINHEITRKIKSTKNTPKFNTISNGCKLNMSQNAYSLLENGKTRIDEQKIIQIVKALQIKPKELISDDLLD